MLRFIVNIACVLAFVLGGVFNAPVADETAAPRLMPPHPLLRGKIDSGELLLPELMTNPEMARAAGFDGFAPQAEDAVQAGTIRALAVLVDFSDKVHQVSASFFDTLIFAAPVVGNGSVRDYWSEVSYGTIDIVSLNLPASLGWKRAPQPYSYYTNGQNCVGTYPHNCQKLAEDVVSAINSIVDFSKYDNNHDGYAEPIMIIHAGAGAEATGDVNAVWSHSWQLNEFRNYDGVVINRYVTMPEYWWNLGDMTIGVFAHEMGHGFWNLPDLYDTYESPGNYGEGVGEWSLMGSGSWNGYYGDTPAWPDAYSRVLMGVSQVKDVTSDTNALAIKQVFNNPPAAADTVFRLRSSRMGSNEYWLLENRERVANSYDAALPGNGLLIWHIDESVYSDNRYECEQVNNSLCATSHYQVALEQADGEMSLEFGYNRGDSGDPFPGTHSNTNWSAGSNPNSGSYTNSGDSFISVTGIGAAGATMIANVSVGIAAPGGLAAAGVSETQIDLAWTDNSLDETRYEIERSANGTSGWIKIADQPANATGYSFTGLACSTRYYYRVRAFRALTGGGAYASVSGVTVPCAPTLLTLKSTSESHIDFSWKDNSTDELGFSIERSPNGATDWVQVGLTSANITTFDDGRLGCQQQYYYRVRALSPDGLSAPTNVISATTAACSLSPAPGNLTASVLSLTAVRLDWLDTVLGETEYLVERADDGSAFHEIGVVAAGGQTFTDSTAEAFVRYEYRIRAWNAAGGGFSPYSVSAFAQTGWSIFLPTLNKP